jgi:hypothetical protein
MKPKFPFSYVEKMLSQRRFPMTKMAQPKWIVITVCLCFGARASFGQLENADAYDQRIREENLAVAKIVKQIDQNRDGSVVVNNGDLTHGDAVAAQKQFLGASWNSQNQINQLLPQIQRTRDDTLKYAASHPGDKKAQANAQEALKVYTNVVKMGNDNGDRIYHATENLHVQDPGTKYPDPPNKIEPAKFAVQKDSKGDTSTQTNPDKPRPSDLELQQLKDGNKPPTPSDTGSDTSNPPKDNSKVPDADSLRNDLQTSQNTKANLDKLIDLSQKYVDQTAQNAKDDPNDPVAQANAENAQADLDKLQAWRGKINDQMTKDLNQLHPPDDKKSADNAKDPPPPDSPDAGEVIYNLFGGPPLTFGMGGVVMASDQGDESTQKFIDTINGNNAADGGAGSDTTNQSKDNARDHAKDVARDAANTARDAANTARDGVRGAAGGMRGCPDGH